MDIRNEKKAIELEYNLICNFIKLRHELGLTQKQMAEESGTIREIIGVLENRKKHPQINTLIKIKIPNCHDNRLTFCLEIKRFLLKLRRFILKKTIMIKINSNNNNINQL